MAHGTCEQLWLKTIQSGGIYKRVDLSPYLVITWKQFILIKIFCIMNEQNILKLITIYSLESGEARNTFRASFCIFFKRKKIAVGVSAASQNDTYSLW